MKRFALFPGHVVSQRDGDRHYIGGVQLARLYGLNPAECVVVYDLEQDYDRSLLPLHPLPSGRYEETLLSIKTNDFWQYERARKLWEYHTSGTSLRRGKLREAAAERQAKSIAWHEKHWPDFEAVYKRKHGK